jgi:allophanate hydrolase
MDIMLLPTTGTIYRHEAVAADPIRLNTNLGYYTNFVNLLDLAAVAVPAGFRTNPMPLAGSDQSHDHSDRSHDHEGVVGLPFGVSLIGPAFSDEALLAVADRFHRAPGPPLELQTSPPGCIPVAVVGAHLSGQPLNWHLTERGARLIETSRTAPGYRLYALTGSVPPKPGLVRDEAFHGSGIEVEVWAVPANRFGSFVAAVPPPLGIGNATLQDGRTVKCFICEPYAIAGAAEITHFGGWRNYIGNRWGML